jgi:hypothetical protein
LEKFFKKKKKVKGSIFKKKKKELNKALVKTRTTPNLKSVGCGNLG